MRANTLSPQLFLQPLKTNDHIGLDFNNKHNKETFQNPYNFKIKSKNRHYTKNIYKPTKTFITNEGISCTTCITVNSREDTKIRIALNKICIKN